MTSHRLRLFRTLIIVTSLSISGYWAWGKIARHRAAQDVAEQINQAQQAAEKIPPGHASAEELIRRLKAIDTGRVSAEVKSAFGEYVAAMEQSLSAIQANQDPAPFEQICADKAHRLMQAMNH